MNPRSTALEASTLTPMTIKLVFVASPLITQY
jgi:hypothetical protein